MNSPRRHRSNQYKWLCKSAAEILADIDTMKLAEGHPDPVSEYSREAAEVIRRIVRLEEEGGGKASSEAVETILREIFHREFEVELDEDDSRNMASSIIALFPDSG